MTLEELGICRRHICAAMDQLACGYEGDHSQASRSTYIFSAEDGLLWDLKIVLRLASNIAKAKLPEFNTRDYKENLLDLGFSLLRFESKRLRVLGVRGYSSKELDDEHVHLLPDGKQIKNGLRPVDTPVDDQSAPPQRKFGSTTRFVRNSNYASIVRRRANGRCECCGEQSFKTPAGEWFLEVHHKCWLREGGTDTVGNMIALCPNCHRREHHGEVRKYS